MCADCSLDYPSNPITWIWAHMQAAKDTLDTLLSTHKFCFIKCLQVSECSDMQVHLHFTQ